MSGDSGESVLQHWKHRLSLKNGLWISAVIQTDALKKVSKPFKNVKIDALEYGALFALYLSV